MQERTTGSGGGEATSGSSLLADPEDYRANCGVGVVFDLDGDGGHDVLADGLRVETPADAAAEAMKPRLVSIHDVRRRA